MRIFLSQPQGGRIYTSELNISPCCTTQKECNNILKYIYIRLITRVSVRYGEIFHEPKASEIFRHISQLTSVISALFL